MYWRAALFESALSATTASTRASSRQLTRGGAVVETTEEIKAAKFGVVARDARERLGLVVPALS